MSDFFFSKDREKAYEEIKQALYNRLLDRKNFVDCDFVIPYHRGLQRGAMSEVKYLISLLDILERS